MSSYTYVFENTKEILEKYEWDNLWLDSTDNLDALRVLYIGDSISCITRRVATETAAGMLYFDGVGTSKAVDNPYFPETIQLFAKQEKSRCAVIFNNGLHGWHLDDETAYKQGYEKVLNFLLGEFTKTPIFLLLTTAVADEDRNDRVVARNKVVQELAEAYNLPVIDLYTITDEHRELISADGVHLVPEGYKLLADKIVSELKKSLK